MSKFKNLTVFIVGMMGAGKTTVGTLLAKKLNYNFIDTDKLIETKMQKSINHIFDLYGEEYFRNLENRILDKVPLKNTVISTGGGFPIYNNNMDKLLTLGKVIYLKSSSLEIYNRLKNSKNRPLHDGTITKINQMLESRKHIYSLANFEIECDKKLPHEVITEIIEKIS